jgi:hypothetical protein
VADEEPVLAPDQLKPGHGKSARIGAIITIAVLLLMLLGNHTGEVEDLWLVASAGLLAAILVGDWVMRRNGVRR